jgi:hypothetical protein
VRTVRCRHVLGYETANASGGVVLGMGYVDGDVWMDVVHTALLDALDSRARNGPVYSLGRVLCPRC